jgi:hypothetical protein
VADFNSLARHQHQHQHQHPNPDVLAFRNAILEKMAMDAGYIGRPQVEEAVRILLDTENTSLSDIKLDVKVTPLVSSFFNPDEVFQHDEALEPVVPVELLSSSCSLGSSEKAPLVPTNLTMAQMEMLLELEWAHRAMIQSYVIGLIDNAFDGHFRHVTSFTIAKIPASHVHLLCREDLWNAIPSLKNISIGVIADWRRVTASAPETIEDTSISPVESVSKVFTLLNDYIGKCCGIESIHFEWICGGEFAPSSYQRNAYILPAPFVLHAELLISPTALLHDTSSLLQLPYVKHLSLKNCWSSPHFLLQAIRQFSHLSLETLELESVSLSGPPTTIEQDVLGYVSMAHAVHILQHLEGIDDVLLALSPLHANDPVNMSTGQLSQPDLFTWPGFIEHFSPSLKIRRILAQQSNHEMGSTSLADIVRTATEHIPHAVDLLRDEQRSKLKCLSFKSCGYVSVEAPYLKTRDVVPALFIGFAFRITNYAIMELMQSSKDSLLGFITQHMKKEEAAALTTGFGMSMGWEGIYDTCLINDARADGVKMPGLGRFSGVLEAADSANWH